MNERQVVFEPECLEDLRYWIQTDRRVALRGFDLIEATRRDPMQGIGHPEPLKHAFKGCWSRRLTSEHRLVYRIFDDRINFLQARFHYE